MQYQSTRGKQAGVTAAAAIVQGIAADGGLFVPDYIPTLNESDWLVLKDSDYQKKASLILGKFLSDFTEEEIRSCVNAAYNHNNFDDSHIAPLTLLKPGVYVQELWHGPTCAFKDMALQILPHLLTVSTAKIGEKAEIVILVATSGDTGKAALEGFKDVAGTRIIVFYPEEGVSEVQKRQMITQTGSNVHVAAVRGNFDDAQNGVKDIFASQPVIDKLARQGRKMSSANSINWGRLLPQIVYYVAACADLMKSGALAPEQKINIVVPTGNFGNILAAYYAKKMGAPINKLICASNANNVLTDFINSGCYNRNRKFEKTISPSMDILISSNLERLLYDLSAQDGEKVAAWMNRLKISGQYQVDDDTLQQIQQLFWAGYTNDEDTLATIAAVWNDDGYLLDTHTAVAAHVYKQYVEATGDNRPTVIVSTASPFKFSGSVAAAIMGNQALEGKDEFAILQMLSAYTGKAIPAGLKDLDKKEILHDRVCSREDMAETVFDFLNAQR